MRNWKYTLTHGVTSLELSYAPAGWDEKSITFMRNETYHSVLRSISASLRFVLDGRAFIIDKYDTYGVNTVISIAIQRRDPSADTFSDYFTGVLDLSKLVITRDYAECPIIDNTILAKFKARDAIEVDIFDTTTLDDASFSNFDLGREMSVEGVTIRQLATYAGEGNVFANSPGGPMNINDDGNPLANAWDASEIDPAETTIPSVGFMIYTNSSSTTQEIWINISLTVDGDVIMTSDPTNASYSFTVKLINDTTDVDTILSDSEVGITSDSAFAVDLTHTEFYSVNVAAGKSLYLKANFTATDSVPRGNCSYYFDFTNVEIEMHRVTPGFATSAPYLCFPHEMLHRLLQKIIGGTVTLNAAILGRTDSLPNTYGSDGAFSLMGIGSGYMIRGFPIDKKPLKTSIKDFIKSIQALTPVGLWYKESDSTWYLYSMDQFYKNTEIIALGEVSEFQRQVDETLYFNSVLVGYEKKVEYEEINGIESANVSVQFANNLSLINNEKDLRSKYRGDDYGIELARKKTYTLYPTYDTKYDSDIFMIMMKRLTGANVGTLQGYDNFSTISGILSQASRLNLDITPKRNLLRNASIVGIPLWKQTTAATKFVGSQYNVPLSTQKASEGSAIVETDDVSKTTLGEPLYHPEVYNFKAPVTAAQIATLMADPHGFVSFYYLGTQYKGYVLEVSTEPWQREGNWTLIKTNPSR